MEKKVDVQDRRDNAPASSNEEQRNATIGFGAVEIGYGTSAKLATYLRCVAKES